jgi:hypothetical protein
MPEYFELTAYCKNGFFKNRGVDLSDFIKTPYTVSFDTVNHIGYTAYTVNIENLVMNEDTLDTLAGLAKSILDKLGGASLVSGTYELTGYNLMGVNTVKQLDSVLDKFPLLFFRCGEEKGFEVYKTVAGISVVYNKEAQDIFTQDIFGD